MYIMYKIKWSHHENINRLPHSLPRSLPRSHIIFCLSVKTNFRETTFVLFDFELLLLFKQRGAVTKILIDSIELIHAKMSTKLNHKCGTRSKFNDKWQRQCNLYERKEKKSFEHFICVHKMQEKIDGDYNSTYCIQTLWQLTFIIIATITFGCSLFSIIHIHILILFSSVFLFHFVVCWLCFNLIHGSINYAIALIFIIFLLVCMHIKLLN